MHREYSWLPIRVTPPSPPQKPYQSSPQRKGDSPLFLFSLLFLSACGLMKFTSINVNFISRGEGTAMNKCIFLRLRRRVPCMW